MTTPPEAVMIDAAPWKVRLMSGAELWAGSGDDLLGHSLYREAELRIRNDMTPTRTAQILWHEAIHAILTAAGHELDEVVVRAIGNGTFATLRNNPDLVRYLMEA